MSRPGVVLRSLAASRSARAILVVAVAALLGCAPRAARRVRPVAPAPPRPLQPAAAVWTPWGEHTIETRLVQIGAAARRRWQDDFARAGVTYPPGSAALVVLKREKRVEVYAGPSPFQTAFVRGIDITAASGGPGPKLREGDRQVPEGVYQVAALNPNSLYHLALRLAYPNEFDRNMAERDHRRALGGDIMIHGGDRSIGCIAVGDLAAEDLFVLAADTGLAGVTVMIAPHDFRLGEAAPLSNKQPVWVRDLYTNLDLRFRELPRRETAVAGGLPLSPALSSTAHPGAH